MTDYRRDRLGLQVKGLARRFGSRLVFRDINFDCVSGESVCIAGRNGTGKSTLLRILAGLLAPTSGRVLLSADGKRVDAGTRRRYVRLVSPDINLFDELTGFENLRFLAAVSGSRMSREELQRALDRVGLRGRSDDFFGEYSSGMKQRLKIAAALMSNPPLLLLDEPSSNLDEEGRELIYRVMEEQKNRAVLIFATNERSEQRFGGKVVELG
jgi:heme exporter protein A